MKNILKLTLILTVALLFVPAAVAQNDADKNWNYLCNPGADVKTVILFGNGIETRPETAHIFTTMLESRVKARLIEEERKLGQSAASITGTLAFCTAYAATSGEVLDRWNANDPTLNRNDFLTDEKLKDDLAKHVMSYDKWLGEGRSVIVVAHSNGNFLANAAHEEASNGRSVEQFYILAVGTTDDHIAGASADRYITLYGDKSTEFPGALSANYENGTPECNKSTDAGDECHDFSAAYLNGDNTGPAIINTIISHIQIDETTQPEISISPMKASVVVGKSVTFAVTTQNTEFDITVSGGAGCVQNGDTVICTPMYAGFYTLTVTAVADAAKTATATIIATWPKPVVVPDVVGQPQFLAQWVFTFLGLKSGTVTQEHSATVAVGNVISQNPVSGALVAPGTPVALVVSLGPVPVTVPNVVGQPQASAEAAIASAGLTVGTVMEKHSFIAAGNVIRQNPAAGALVVPGTSVELVISLGPALVGIEVSRNPDKLTYLMGEQLDLTGLQVRTIFGDGSKEQTENYIVSESGNTLFTAGSVSITVISQKNTAVKTSFNINVSNTLIDTGLPVIYINTQNAAPIISKEDYVKTNIKIVSDNPDYCLESTDDYRHEIRGRGNTTWLLSPKKPFRVRFASKTSLFGLTSARNWVLMANHLYDTSLLKDTVAFELGQRMELPFTNHSVHVDVVLNGVYHGNYMLTEHRQVGQGRVDIDENEGFLVEMDVWYDEEPKFRSNILDLPFMIKSPENLTDQSGYDFVKESINELEAALFDPGFPDSGYRDMIDMDTFVNYILVNDILLNYDIQYPASVFMYKDKDGKISMGPLWDFNGSFGVLVDKQGAVKELFSMDCIPLRIPYYMYPTGGIAGQKFFQKFFEDPVFLEAYKTRWNEKYSEIVKISDFINAMYDKIRNSALLNDKRWFDGLLDYDDEIGKMKRWYSARVEYLDTDINRISNKPDPLEGNLLILQAYGTGSATDGAVSHSFVELYNTTDAAVNLSGYSLQYAAGTKASLGATEDGDWTVINLSGTIPAKGSYLILGKKNNAVGRLQIADGSGDINVPTMELSNRAFKVALIHGTKKLAAQNPFNTDGAGKKSVGYIDMVGAVNDVADRLFGYEAAPARISKQVAARRITLVDTDNNSVDFGAADYRTGSSGMTAEELEIKKPRNSSVGAWNPMTGEVYEPEEPEEPGEPDPLEGKLLILQAYGTGNATDGAVSHSFVELYNTTDTSIDLSGYSLQYAAGTKVSAGATEDGNWTVINLSGTIPARVSYLILGKKKNASGRLQIADYYGDINVGDMELSNRAFKAALIHGTRKLDVQNPFNIDGTGKNAAGYIDMVGAVNDSTDKIRGYETAPAGISKQKSVRRITLSDTGNNAADFESVDYRLSGINAEELEIKKPRNSSVGAWNP